jgi:hypothetical protein
MRAWTRRARVPTDMALRVRRDPDRARVHAEARRFRLRSTDLVHPTSDAGHRRTGSRPVRDDGTG